MKPRGVLLDLAGCLYEGDAPIPGASEALNRLREAGLALRFLTNTTRARKAQILGKLTAMGLELGEDEVFTPVEAAQGWLKDHEKRAFALVHPALEAAFEGGDPNAQPAVVVGDAGEAFTYDRLNAAFGQIMDGAPLLALAQNRYFQGDGRLQLDAGPFVAALEYASGQEAQVLGKPAPAFFDLALASMDVPPERAVMVGDDAEADVRGALRAGMGAAFLVRTGKYRPGDEVGNPAPTGTLADIGEVAEAILTMGR